MTSGDFQRVDAVLQVSASANRELYRHLQKEDQNMCEALREIMREDFEAAEARGLEKGMEKGRAEGMEKGRAEGMEKGEILLGTLMTKLKELGRLDDAFRAAEDKQFREKLYKEFKMA